MHPRTADPGTAVEQWLILYGDLLHSLSRKLCRGGDGTEDLFQETWVRALSALNRRPPPDRPDKWLITLCLNTFRDQYRRHRIMDRLGMGGLYGTAALQTAVDHSKGPEASAVEADENRRLMQAVDSLKDSLRIPVILYYFHDYGVNDVAGMMGIKSGTVKSRLHTARERLRKEMTRHG